MDSHQHGPKCGCSEYMFNEDANDLLSSIDKEALECLNEAQVGSCKNIFRIDEQKFDKQYFVESDSDAEFILIVPFIETVRIKSINVIAFDEQTSPDYMRTFINTENIDFEIIKSEGAQSFQISPNLSGEYGCAVKLSVFENVNKLVLHFSSKHNDPIKISYIGIKGIRTEMKRKLAETTYELIPLPKDGGLVRETTLQGAF